MLDRKPRTMRDMTILGGWLFADLLLALMVIFLAAQPAFPKPLPPTPTPIPTFSPTVSPSPTPEPRLDFNFTQFSLTGEDFQGIENNTPSAVIHMENDINNIAAQKHLQSRSAGLVIVADGSNTDQADYGIANQVVSKIIANVLNDMGKKRQLFERASYYGPIYLIGSPHSNVNLDIYFFKQ